MKSKLILTLLSFFLFSNTAYAQSEIDTLRNGLSSIVSCQATFKIAAVYIDIYQAFKEDLEKTDPAAGSNAIEENLKADWESGEKISVEIGNILIQSNSITSEQITALYNLEQTRLLQKIVESVPAKEQIQMLFHKSAQCSKVIEELTKLLKN